MAFGVRSAVEAGGSSSSSSRVWRARACVRACVCVCVNAVGLTSILNVR